ncbi:sodium-coupled monocarboxylate transporter 1-like [Phlebotomus argentipes]|uniref:sodium-coupled monocarboxylate transporter 1-like n=1 Tax=Phlebotomus argentipes TaxID=94469 RepID=UPI0028934F46|nr:sodium-coupled monocarboxylate transporter 1-like [Phlebotomus argentipes]
MQSLEDLILRSQKFSLPDYLVFVTMLFFCILIGIYFGFIKNVDTESEYLVGGRQMQVFPIALSLIASFISGITLLGLPTEVYSYGIQYLYVISGVLLMGITFTVVYLPVFQGLHITSMYQYLEKRFDRRLRLYGSIMFTIMNVSYLPIVIYVPSIAFNQVTGVNIHICSIMLVVVCVFYTCVGGLKAVVWTDVVQCSLMFTALILVAVKGTFHVNGPEIVLKSALETNRIEPPIFDIDPTIRHSFWCLSVGGLFYWVQTNANSQNMIQRYLALPSLRESRKAVWIFVTGVILLMLLCAYNGLLIFATYRDCDPLTTKLAKARDQLLPLFVMDTLGELPGLSGMFIAGVFSAALSSLSTCLNSMSAVVLEDFCKPFTRTPLSTTATIWIMRSVVVGVGALCVCLVFVVEKLGTVLQLTMSLEAITNGPLLGIFTIGILLPSINGTGALTGGIFGVLLMSWISLNAQWAIASGSLKFDTKPMSVDGCNYLFNYTSTIYTTQTPIDVESSVMPLYRISYMWYTALGAISTIIVAFLVNLVLGGNDPHLIDASLISPIIRKYYGCTPKPTNEEETIKDVVEESYL